MTRTHSASGFRASYRPLAMIATMLALLLISLSSVRAEDQAAKDERMKWFREARLGMFIHWGLYSSLGGEWKEKHVTGGAEWIQKYLEIPSSQYSPLAASFSAPRFDADAWVKAIAASGVKYICITTKHHDGFCMWPTKLNDGWNISATPFKRDPLKEISEACQRHGVTFCIYHSILDWHHPDWPGRPAFNDFAKGTPDKEKFRQYLYGQLRELFTNYGPIGMIWLDGSWDRSVWTSDDGKQLEDFLRTMQPSTIINNRSGHLPPQPKLDIHVENAYSYTFAGDYISPEGEVPSTGLPGIDWETCQTMQLPNNWGYSRIVGFRPFPDLLRQMIDVASKGGNLLLNIGPTGAGEIPPQALGCLEKFGAWMKVNGEAIHGTTATPVAYLPFEGRCTRKGNLLYFHIFNWPASGEVVLPLANTARRAYLLADRGTALVTTVTPAGIKVRLPAVAPDRVATVLAVELDGEPRPHKAPVLLSAGIKPGVSSTWPGREKDLRAEFITDGKPATMWAAEEKAREAIITLPFAGPKTISGVTLNDSPYGRITSFDVEAQTSAGWVNIGNGTRIGPALHLPVAGVSATAVRLVIHSATDTPTIAEFQVHGTE